MTRRRWIADEWNADRATLRDAQAAHLARVLRARPGQEFDIVAGGFVRRGVIESVSDTAVQFLLREQIETSSPLPLIIGLSIVRFERMEWAIEKLTELGVGKIVPLVAQRSEKHLVQAATKRAERWRKIARESAQQSRRSDIPEISGPTQPTHWAKESSHGLRILLSEEEMSRTLAQCLRAEPLHDAPEIFVAIGPEGGWTSAEIDLFGKQGWKPVTIGPRILRTETAAIAAVSIVSAWLQDRGTSS